VKIEGEQRRQHPLHDALILFLMMLEHVVRQTRLRDKAKARMAAKFGNNAAGSMGGAGPSSGSRPPAACTVAAFGKHV
jgi:hypothetical protein